MKRIPKALREQVWRVYNGNKFEAKCWVQWCENLVTPFTFEAGHNIPRSKGGTDDIDNLRPICSGRHPTAVFPNWFFFQPIWETFHKRDRGSKTCQFVLDVNHAPLQLNFHEPLKT